VKYSLGLLTQEQYNQRLENLETAEIIGLYIKLEKDNPNFIKLKRIQP